MKRIEGVFAGVLLFTLVVVFPSVVSAGWTMEDVDAPKYFRECSTRAIALDTLDGPHMAYGGDHLYHVYFDGTQWQYEVADNEKSLGMHASIAVDSNNHVHISYIDWVGYGTYELKYATNASDSWVAQTLDGADEQNTFIAVDSSNNVHISYSSDWITWPPDLKYATNASGAWVTQTIGQGGGPIAVDLNDNVHIISGSSHYTNASGSWVEDTIIIGGSYPSFAIDSNNKLHVTSYTNDYLNDLSQLKYATNASGAWVIQVLDSGNYTSMLTINFSIAIDSDNKAHVAYSGWGGFKYATNASGSWITNEIDETWGIPSIAVDSNNNPHVSYYDGYGGDAIYSGDGLFRNLKYAENTSGSWLTQILDSASKVGIDTSIALDSSNKAHISYHDDINKDLKYATNASGSWIADTVDSEGWGDYTSIAVDSADKVHISYYGLADLKYATNASGSWVIQVLDGEINVYAGWYTSIVVDSADKVHISYHDGSNGDLKYATNASGSWVTQILDSVGDVGLYTSIAVDSADKVHISYHDESNGDLKYATNAGGSWVTQVLDSAGGVGRYTSIAVDSNDKVHISYHDGSNGVLKYATDASGSWVIQIVDNWPSYQGMYTSIAVDLNNKAHISYLDESSYGDLQYATNAGGSWVIQTIDSEEWVGLYTSIALDSNNKVHISYHDATNGDLRYAYGDLGPDISVSPPAHHFGDVLVGDSSSLQSFFVTNMGAADLEIGTISLTGSNPSEFLIQQDDCSWQILPPSGECSLMAVFVPSSVGGKIAFLSIPSNDPHTPIFDVALIGTAMEEGPIIDKIGNRMCLPSERIRIIGSGFGDTQGDSVVHINNLTYGPGHARIRSWSDTKIRLKVPYNSKPCAWYTHGDGQYRRRSVWVTVSGVDSNTKYIKVLKPASCQ